MQQTDPVSYRARLSAGMSRLASGVRGERTIGHVDAVCGTTIEGWALDVLQPHRPLPVEIFSGDRLLATATADRPRPDLRRAGFGSGRNGFEVKVPRPVGFPLGAIPITVRVARRARPLTFQGRDTFEIGPEVFLRWVAADIVNNCNLRCPFCVVDYSVIHNTRLMSPETYARLLTLLDHVPDGAFWLSCLHEPTLHPKLGDFIGMVPAALGHKLSFTTNLARRLPDDLLAIWARSRMHHINVSFDTLNETLFSFLRRPGRLPVFLDNLQRMTDIFREHPDAPRLRYITMALRSNLDEIPEIVRRTQEEHLSSENEIRYTFNVGHITDEFRREQYPSAEEWDLLTARLERLPYPYVITYPPPGAEELSLGSANYQDVRPSQGSFDGPGLEPPIGLRARMDGVVMVADYEGCWAADINTLDDPPAFLHKFSDDVCRKR